MKNLQLNGMRELSFKEIEDVSGGWLPWAIGGALAGGYSFGRQTYDTFSAIANREPIPEFSFAEVGEATLVGAGATKLGKWIEDLIKK